MTPALPAATDSPAHLVRGRAPRAANRCAPLAHQPPWRRTRRCASLRIMSYEDDVTLLERARGGDRRALDALLVRVEPVVHKFGLKLCRDNETAQEVLQETLLTAARHLATFRGDSALSTWLYMVAKSVCIKQRRRSTFAPVALEPLEAAHEVSSSAGGGATERPDLSLERAELGAHLQRAITSLEPMYREVLVLRDVEGLSAAEVGEALDLSIEAVKSRLHRARTRVREALAPLLGAEQAPAAGCPDVVTFLWARLEGDINADSCQQMEQHLAACPECTARCDSLRATLRMCHEVGAAGSVSAAVRTSVEQAVRDFLRRRAHSDAPA
jgi:RNA polymerase sigma-70 factor (ECF subfamily)